METLILGNGISRLSFKDIIYNWPGEVWGCNRAYLDFPKKLTHLHGHADVMELAKEYREEGQHSYKVFGEGELKLTCPPEYHTDTGTTLIAEALSQGRSIAVCGFDLGGLDIHSPGLEKVDKHNWVDRWRKIVKEFGSDKIRFIGFGHLPFIESRESITKYSKKYIAGKPHIYDKEYIEAFELWTGRKGEIGYKGDYMVKVRFTNGYVTDMVGEIAEKYEKAGKLEILDKKKKSTRKKKVETETEKVN